jgi:hypothetical protein
MALLGRREIRAMRDQLALAGMLATPVLPVLLAPLALSDLQALLAQAVLLVLSALLGHKALLVGLGLKVPKA